MKIQQPYRVVVIPTPACVLHPLITKGSEEPAGILPTTLQAELQTLAPPVPGGWAGVSAEDFRKWLGP